MKLIEYLAPLSKASQQKRILAVLYFLERTKGRSSFSIGDIRAALAEARTTGLKSWNISARLGGSGAYLHATGSGLDRVWELTDTGRHFVEGFAPELHTSGNRTENSGGAARVDDVAALRWQVARISDAEAKAFASEAVDCLEIGAHRAAIVFMWVAAVHEIQDRIWSAATPSQITAAAQSHNSRAKSAKKRDDLVEYNEDLLLQIAQDLGVLDKNEKSELGKALSLRNSAGHPNKLRPGEHKAKAHIEELLGMLF